MIYSQYTERIKRIVSDNQSKKLEKSLHLNDDMFNNKNIILGHEFNQAKIFSEQRTFNKKQHLNLPSLENSIPNVAISNSKIGLHPDFKHLKNTDGTANHYIVSVFIDIMGSTNLFKSYSLEEIYGITNTIQCAAIDTCVRFGGHIQRLQGDGVFAYFGGKTINRKFAIKMSLLACSMFTYFVKNDLRNIFEVEGIEDIKTRIGIDFGDDDKVLWANFGMLDVSELTTLSLHTSLASKMQAYAKPNGIVIGKNIVEKTAMDSALYDYVRNYKGEVEKCYIFEDNKNNFRYSQHEFKWFEYLTKLPFINNIGNGVLTIDLAKFEEILEKERINRLHGTTKLINTDTAYLDKYGRFSDNSSGVKVEPNRFHYGK